ncbi:MAG: LysR family transcriptional regulator [Pseudomonadota bacterium]
MNIVGLRTFLTIVDRGSLVRAAEHLNVTQSTVTARLKALEEELGQQLVLRQKTGVVLTPAGANFKRYAQTMVDLWHQAKQETSLPDGIRAVCNLGCDPDLWPRLGRPLAAAIRRDHEEVALSVRPGDETQLEQWLGAGLVDVVLTYRPSSGEGQSSHHVMDEKLIVCSSLEDGPLRFDPRYIYVDAGEEFGRRHTAAYTDAGIAKVSFTSAVWALDHLLERGGSAYLPERLAEEHLRAKRLFKLKNAPVFSRSVYLVTNDGPGEDWPWLPDLAKSI